MCRNDKHSLDWKHLEHFPVINIKTVSWFLLSLQGESSFILSDLFACSAASRSNTLLVVLFSKTVWQRSCVCVFVCTWMPEVVKYGISNLTLIGGFPSLSSASTLGRPKWARIKYSFPPCERKSQQKLNNTELKLWKTVAFNSKRGHLDILNTSKLNQNLGCYIRPHFWAVCVTLLSHAHREGLDWPDDLAVLRHPLHTAHCGLKLGRVCVCWHRNVDLHVVGCGTPFELTLRLRRENKWVKFNTMSEQGTKPGLNESIKQCLLSWKLDTTT